MIILEMQKSVSIIVPIYRGQKYIEGLVRQIEEGVMEIPGYYVELLFVNDDPDIRIDVEPESDIKIGRAHV